MDKAPAELDAAKLGVRISELRQQRGLTQDELAKALGLSRLSVWRWEDGQAAGVMKLSVAVRLAHVLGVPLGELVQ